jgi:hypothetical protein
MSNPAYNHGQVTGTGSAITVASEKVGFRPKRVRLTNLTSRVALEWDDSMADASAIKTAANGDRTVVTSAAITPTASGFTVGTDSINASGEIILFEAWG